MQISSLTDILILLSIRFNCLKTHFCLFFVANIPRFEDSSPIPRLEETRGTPEHDRIIYERFCFYKDEWHATEYSPDERIFYGYGIRNGDLRNGQWGYFTLDKMRRIRDYSGREVWRDTDWTPKRAGDVDRVREALKYSRRRPLLHSEDEWSWEWWDGHSRSHCLKLISEEFDRQSFRKMGIWSSHSRQHHCELYS